MMDVSEKQKAEWIEEFKSIGPNNVWMHVRNGDYPQSHAKTIAAMQWLKDHEPS